MRLPPTFHLQLPALSVLALALAAIAFVTLYPKNPAFLATPKPPAFLPR